MIAGRPGFHNALAVRPDGRVTFSCFGRDGKTSRLLISRNPLIPGKRHRVAGTMDCSRDNHTAMKLYIDGALEAADTLPMPPRITAGNFSSAASTQTATATRNRPQPVRSAIFTSTTRR